PSHGNKKGHGLIAAVPPVMPTATTCVNTAKLLAFHLANAAVEGVGDVQIAVRIEGNAEGTIELRLQRRPTIAGVTLQPGAGNGMNRAVGQVDHAYAIVVR